MSEKCVTRDTDVRKAPARKGPRGSARKPVRTGVGEFGGNPNHKGHKA